jgi:hypothetical protein
MPVSPYKILTIFRSTGRFAALLMQKSTKVVAGSALRAEKRHQNFRAPRMEL